jgi:hypothetical protein
MSRKRDLERKKPPRLRGTAALARFTGDSGSGGTQGMVPTPGAGDAESLLKGDGTWGGIGVPAGGEAGQILTHDGDGPVWTSPGSAAGSVALTTGVVSNQATLDLPLDVAGYSSYRIFKLFVYNLLPADDDSALLVRFSDDGGATFEVDASDYSFASLYTDENSTSFEIGDDASTGVLVAVSLGNGAAEHAHFEFTIYDPAGSGRTHIAWQGCYVDFSPDQMSVTGSGVMATAGASTDIRLLMDTGNLSCRYSLLGIA